MRHHGLLFLLILGCCKSQAQQVRTPVNDSMRFSKSLKVLPQNYYTTHLGFFCKQELHLQKRTNLNVYIRLGSKEYVDYLERKPNAGKF